MEQFVSLRNPRHRPSTLPQRQQPTAHYSHEAQLPSQAPALTRRSRVPGDRRKSPHAAAAPAIAPLKCPSHETLAVLQWQHAPEQRSAKEEADQDRHEQRNEPPFGDAREDQEHDQTEDQTACADVGGRLSRGPVAAEVATATPRRAE